MGYNSRDASLLACVFSCSSHNHVPCNSGSVAQHDDSSCQHRAVWCCGFSVNVLIGRQLHACTHTHEGGWEGVQQ
jgi:hypothetical protein